VSVEDAGDAAQQHEGAGGTRFGQIDEILIGGLGFEGFEHLVELPQEVVRRVSEDRVPAHPPRRAVERFRIADAAQRRHFAAAHFVKNLAGLGVKRKVLKKGKLQLAGMDGEQWLGRFDDGDSAQHGFYAETDIRRPSSLHPKLMLEMFTGGESDSGEPVASSLSDEQAILLWERIVGSFRVRPGG